jgi:predicted ATPase
MIQIDRIEIRYFRSIYRISLRNLTDIIVLAGRNDVGKSNILKALNLFFNNQTDWNSAFDFGQDFSFRRRSEVRKKTIKGKQFIQISVGFVRGNRYLKSLPDRFTVTRTWYRDSSSPVTKSSLNRQFKIHQIPTKNIDRALASLPRYLNTIRFEYIPAIKDSSFFTYMLGRLQDVILGRRSRGSGIASAVQELNSTVEREAIELREEFNRVTNVPIDIRLPDELADLFRAFGVATKSGDEELPLSLRGDGIRLRFLPSLLHYISRYSNLNFIWGFEEPENSLEHALATRLAREIVDVYSRGAQVFLTSHSPAFFGLRDHNVTGCRVFLEDGNTAVEKIPPNGSPPFTILEKEIGLMEFQEQCQREYEAKLYDLEVQKRKLKETSEKIRQERSPALLSEGKWDALILVEAWKKLHGGKRCTFRILSCDPMVGNQTGGAGGAQTLKSCLETVRPDEPIIIGLFDRDHEGYKKGFEGLNKNFKPMERNANIKIQRNGTAAAIILPPIPGREKYADVLNLELEFYFEDQYLRKKIQGKGLIFEKAEVEEKLVGTGHSLGRKKKNEPQFRQIQDASKKVFAEQVVPTLPAKAFTNFNFLFKIIKEIIAELKKMRRGSQTAA